MTVLITTLLLFSVIPHTGKGPDFSKLKGPYEGIVYPIPNRYYLPGIKALFRKAKKEIRVFIFTARYYREYKGDVGKKLLSYLKDALKRGVKVELILDASDWNKRNSLHNKLFAEELKKYGADVWYDPPDITSHDKLIVVDSEYVVVGSTNWSFYALMANNEASAIIRSPGLARYYLHYLDEVKRVSMRDLPSYYGWKKFYERQMRKIPNSKEGTSMPKSLPAPAPCIDGYKALIYPVPNRNYTIAIHELFSHAEDTVLVAMLSARTYPRDTFEFNEILVHNLIGLGKRGVYTELILDGSNFNRVNTVQNKEQFIDILKPYGINAHFDSYDVTTHAKLIIVDDRYVLFGSTNWTLPAFEWNDEGNVLVVSKGLAEYFKKYFEVIKKHSPNKLPSWYRTN